MRRNTGRQAPARRREEITVGRGQPRNNESRLRRPLFLAGGQRKRGATLGNEVASHNALSRKGLQPAWSKRGLDIALALVVFGVTLGTATGFLDTGSYTDSIDPLNVTLAAVAALPLAAARRAP